MTSPMFDPPEHLLVPVDENGDGSETNPDLAVGLICWCGGFHDGCPYGRQMYPLDYVPADNNREERLAAGQVEEAAEDTDSGKLPGWALVALVAVIGVVLFSVLRPTSTPEPTPVPSPTSPIYAPDPDTETVPLPSMPLTAEDIAAVSSLTKDVASILGNETIDGIEKNRLIGDRAVTDLVVQPDLFEVNPNGTTAAAYTPIFSSMSVRDATVEVPTDFDVFRFTVWKNDDGTWTIRDATSRMCERTQFCYLNNPEGGKPPEGYNE